MIWGVRKGERNVYTRSTVAENTTHFSLPLSPLIPDIRNEGREYLGQGGNYTVV